MKEPKRGRGRDFLWIHRRKTQGGEDSVCITVGIMNEKKSLGGGKENRDFTNKNVSQKSPRYLRESFKPYQKRE